MDTSSWKVDSATRRCSIDSDNVFITYTRPTFKDAQGDWHRELKNTAVKREDGEPVDTWMVRVKRIAASEITEMNAVPAEPDVDGDITALITEG